MLYIVLLDTDFGLCAFGLVYFRIDKKAWKAWFDTHTHIYIYIYIYIYKVKLLCGFGDLQMVGIGPVRLHAGSVAWVLTFFHQPRFFHV